MRRERVAVAMSGGVDSSVAAALLVEQGYEVVGLTMQIWPKDELPDDCSGLRACCGLEAVEDARRVARTIGIRHYVVDLREAFQHLVVDRFCDQYLQGRTPNPCIMCNTDVKFGLLLRRAEQVGAQYLATGHYARVGLDTRRGRWVIWRAVDRTKEVKNARVVTFYRIPNPSRHSKNACKVHPYTKQVCYRIAPPRLGNWICYLELSTEDGVDCDTNQSSSTF